MADLSLYNYEVRHITGSTNTAADALSRMYPEESLALLEIDVSPDWTDAYKADPALLELCYQPDGQLLAVVFGLETVFWSQHTCLHTH